MRQTIIRLWSRPCIPLCIVLLLALFLRLMGLTYHSLWLDEAVSVNWARLPLAELWQRTITLREDSHPPLYYVSLHLWTRLFGDGEGAVRGLSVAFGLLLVAAIYGLGKEMGGKTAAALAGLLAAMNPYLVWYGQETRMYAMVGALSATGVLCLWRGLEDGRGRWWLGYLIATISSIYAQIIGSLLLPVHLLMILLAAATGHRRHVREGIIAVALASLAFAPLAVTAWHSSGATSTERVAPTLSSLLVTTPVILLLRQVPAPWQVLAVPGVAVAILGAARVLRDDLRRGLSLLLYGLVTLGLIFVLSIWRLPIFGAPYIIVVAAPFLVMLGLGVGWIWQRAPAAGLLTLAALCFISAVGLRYDWDRSMGKEDWRSAATYIAQYAGPGDAILAVPDYARIPLAYYYRGVVSILSPFGSPVQPRGIEPALSSLGEYETVWLVWSHGEQIDPEGQIRRWLMERYPVLTEQYPRGVEIRALAVQYRLGAIAGAPLATFGGKLHLLDASADRVATARDAVYHPPSGWVHVQLVWQRVGEGDLSGLYVRLRVVDHLGQVWGERLQRPTEVWRFYPPERWQRGEAVRDAYDINMNPVTPPGRFQVELQVLDKNGSPLPVQTANASDNRYVVSAVEIRGSGAWR